MHSKYVTKAQLFEKEIEVRKEIHCREQGLRGDEEAKEVIAMQLDFEKEELQDQTEQTRRNMLLKVAVMKAEKAVVK